MVKNVLSASMLALLIGLPTTVQSAEHVVGKVTRIYPNSAGVYFRLSGTCKTNAYFYFSLSNDSGKAWYAMLLSAAVTKQPVRVAIGEACDPAMNQTIQYVYQDF
jgi:hypothetical protein